MHIIGMVETIISEYFIDSASPWISSALSASEVSDAAVWAVQEGITTGTTSSTFTPDRACSRGEILTFLFRTYG